ncbi:MAG: cupin domain-containing protein [Bifidobacteriaceae bacterium]|jgi:ethanolamine utilization protein EutQ|nr:cupin domain-containing protein [Bifidobacteriaceae bacterium]
MQLDRATLEAIIRDAVKAELAAQATAAPRQLDPSGVIGINPDKIPLEPFPFPIDAQRVQLVDVLSLDESPRLGCGLMEMETTAFEWTLTYDEIDYVISGTLDIVVDGRTVRATAGQIIFIPKNTKIHFSTPDKVRFMYVCYPANWADQ